MYKTEKFLKLVILFIIVCIIIITFSKTKSECSEMDFVNINIDQIIKQESNGRENAISSKNAIGLMQITKDCLSDYNNFAHDDRVYYLSDLTNKDVNVKIGTWYLNKRIPQMLHYYRIQDSVKARLIAYNAGISYVIKWKKAGMTNKVLPNETINYIADYFESLLQLR